MKRRFILLSLPFTFLITGLVLLLSALSPARTITFASPINALYTFPLVLFSISCLPSKCTSVIRNSHLAIFKKNNYTLYRLKSRIQSLFKNKGRGGTAHKSCAKHRRGNRPADGEGSYRRATVTSGPADGLIILSGLYD